MQGRWKGKEPVPVWSHHGGKVRMWGYAEHTEEDFITHNERQHSWNQLLWRRTIGTLHFLPAGQNVMKIPWRKERWRRWRSKKWYTKCRSSVMMHNEADVNRPENDRTKRKGKNWVVWCHEWSTVSHRLTGLPPRDQQEQDEDEQNLRASRYARRSIPAYVLVFGPLLILKVSR